MATTWGDIYQGLENGPSRLALTFQFMVFMKENGLGELDLVTLASARAFQTDASNTKSTGGRVGKKTAFRRNLLAMCNAALAKMGADGIFATDDVECHDGWGRVALITSGWKMSVGVLYDEHDHGTSFIKSSQPLDIIVRIQTNPVGLRKQALEAARSSFEPLRSELAEIGFDINPGRGGWRSNRHTIVLAHYRNGFPWEVKTVREQIAVLASVFSDAWRILNKPEYAREIKKLPSYD